MAYVTQSEIEAELPPAFLVEALDDDGDGSEDAGLWDKVEASVAETIDGILGQRFAVPFSAPVPAVVKMAARVLVLELLYFRRSITPNPWEKRAQDIRAKLGRIADGDEPLTPGAERVNQSVSAITEAAKTTNGNGNLAT